MKAVQDYEPFGSPMPKRNVPGAGYEYGFHGQPKDNEIHDVEGSSYVFEYRQQDSRIGRFMSIDPIANKYSAIAPYVFSENRSIDGVDMEGLEYYSIHVKIQNGTRTLMETVDYTGLSDAAILGIHGMPASKFYKEYSKSFGPLGRGVEYVYHDLDEGKIRKRFENKVGLTLHDVFYGAEGIYRTGPIPGHNPPSISASNAYYDFDKPPIDMVDTLAKTHDIQYAAFSEGYPAPHGWVRDERTLEADKQFMVGLELYLNLASNPDFNGPYTGKPPSCEAIFSAGAALGVFKGVAMEKATQRGLKTFVKWGSITMKKLSEKISGWAGRHGRRKSKMSF